MVSLTGTERAALRLALGSLRHADPVDVSDGEARSLVLHAAGTLAWHGWGAVDLAARSALDSTPPRVVRARLALYLRAVLRADSWEEWDRTWGGSIPKRWPVVCAACSEPVYYAVGERVEECPVAGPGRRPLARHPEPLWSQVKR